MNKHTEMQKKILRTYIQELGKSTIRELARDSKIQQTRIFRLMNGSEMKISEYLIIKSRIAELMSKNSDLMINAENCENTLSYHGLSQLSVQMKRKAKLAQIINSKKKVA